VAGAAGLPTRALITDMNQVLGRTAGNALEVREAIDFLAGRGAREPRLEAVTIALAGEMLALSGVARDAALGEAMGREALASGAAAERFARMVHTLGGPRDVMAARFGGLAKAKVQLDVPAPADGVIAAMDTRELGLVVVDLGGGRRVARDAIDPAVGLSHVQPIGTRVVRGVPLLRVHAATREAARAAASRVLAAVSIADKESRVAPVVIEKMASG
jgi:thymidine phosphorylase